MNFIPFPTYILQFKFASFFSFLHIFSVTKKTIPYFLPRHITKINIHT